MKAKYLSLLLAAVLLGQTPANAKDNNDKPKTEQQAKQKGKKRLFGKKKRAQTAEQPKDSTKAEKPRKTLQRWRSQASTAMGSSMSRR